MIFKLMIALFFCSMLSGQVHNSVTQKLLNEGKEIFRQGLGYSETEFKNYEKIFVFHSGQLTWDGVILDVLTYQNSPEILEPFFEESRSNYENIKRENGEFVDEIIAGNIDYSKELNTTSETDNPSESNSGLKAELSELKNLYDQGLINEEEYQAARKKILNK